MCSKPVQCESKDFMKSVRCQGIPRHNGPHWAYDEGGHLVQWKNGKDKDPKWERIGCRWIPPGNGMWISPLEMNQYHYLTIWATNERNKRRNAENGKTGKR
jgi:hypothetical protein